jgi:hypothetical protein
VSEPSFALLIEEDILSIYYEYIYSIAIHL